MIAKKRKINLIIALSIVLFTVLIALCGTLGTSKNKAYASSITENDVYFGAGVSVATLSLDGLRFFLYINESVFDDITNIKFEFNTADGSLQNCSIYNDAWTPEDGDGYWLETEYVISIYVETNDLDQEISLRAIINDDLTVKSRSISLIYVLQRMNENGLDNYFDPEDEDLPSKRFSIQKLLESYTSGYYLKAQTSNYFVFFSDDVIDLVPSAITIDNPTAIYRVKPFVFGSIWLNFNIEQNNKLFDILITGSSNVITVDDTNSPFETIDFQFWRDGDYYYFTFDFLKNLGEEDTLLVTTHDVEVAYAPIVSDTEYTNSLLAELEQLRARYNEQVALISEKQVEINALKQSINGLNKQISDFQFEIESLKSAHASELETLNKLHAQAIQSLEDSHAQEIDELNAQHTVQVEQLNKAHNEAITALNENLKKASADLEKYKSEVKDLTAEKEALEEALEGDNADLMRAYNELIVVNNKLQAENDKLSKENEELRSRLEEDKKGLSFGCGSVGDGASGTGAGATLLLTMLGFIALYLGVRYERRKNKAQ